MEEPMKKGRKLLNLLEGHDDLGRLPSNTNNFMASNNV